MGSHFGLGQSCCLLQCSINVAVCAMRYAVWLDYYLQSGFPTSPRSAQAFPGHCDCLALANIQASLLNIADANPLHHCDGYPDVKPSLADIRATSDKSETIPCSL